MARILVTGAGGFIGRHVMSVLRTAGHDVLGYDLRQPPGEPTWPVVIGSVRDEEAIYRAIKEHRSDTVIHLAAAMGVAFTEGLGWHTLDINVCGTKNVLVAAERSKTVVRFMLTSSSEVYGAHEDPVDEDSDLLGRSVYAESKRCAEAHVRESFIPQWMIFRLFNVFGPGQADNFVVSKFLRQGLAGEPITVYGDGDQQRAFCYVEDMAGAFLSALVSDRTSWRQTYNIGNPGNLVTMLDLASMVIALTGSIARRPILTGWGAADRDRSRDLMHRCPVVERAKHKLGWRPHTPLDEGLIKTVEEMRHGNR